MKGILVDSNILLDLFLNDQEWADWSESQLDLFSYDHILYINAMIYSEVSIGFEKIEEIFLPYAYDISTGKTLFQHLENRHFDGYLLENKGDDESQSEV